MLRPGTHVLSRGGGELQVGLDPAQALVLPDSSAVQAALRLDGPGAEADPATVRLLRAHGLLVDERTVLPLLDGSLPRASTAALSREAGPAAPAVRRSRQRSRTAVLRFGHPDGEALRVQAVALARSAGLREHRGRGGTPDAALLVGVGEPDREVVDPWLRDGVPHLLVRLTEGRALVGPFVAPGSTACLRCVDAHCTDADAAWPLLVRQYAVASAHDRPDGAPEPVDPALAALAVAWAVRDLMAYVDGQRPATWSATVTVPPRLDRIDTDHWLRHPACSCAWD